MSSSGRGARPESKGRLAVFDATPPGGPGHAGTLANVRA
jgi:hypothetical protein